MRKLTRFMRKSVGKLTRKIDKQEFDVTHKEKNICHIPTSKKETVKMLRTFMFNECNKYWRTLPAPVATLKRQFLTELMEKLEN